MKAYQKPVVKDYGYYALAERSRHTHTHNQLRVLRMLLKWRDYVARLDDESCHYMLPNHILFAIAKEMPTTKNEMRDCRRASAEPPAIQKYQDQLMALISAKLAKESHRVTESKKLNIDFTKQSMPKPSATKEIKKTQSACTSVFKLDRESQLPTVRVLVAP